MEGSCTAARRCWGWAGAADKQDKRREHRRKRRLRNQSLALTCFGCREQGHALQDCPNGAGTGLCYKCGTAEHKTGQCRKNVVGFPFAQCFICKEKGHLTRSCPDNPRGLYPQGGSCKQCGSVEHLLVNCPERRAGKHAKIRLGRLSVAGSADAEDDYPAAGADNSADDHDGPHDDDDEDSEHALESRPAKRQKIVAKQPPVKVVRF